MNSHTAVLNVDMLYSDLSEQNEWVLHVLEKFMCSITLCGIRQELIIATMPPRKRVLGTFSKGNVK